MSDDNALTRELGQTRHQALIVEVEFHNFVEEVGLAYEQVCRPLGLAAFVHLRHGKHIWIIHTGAEPLQVR